MKPFTATLLAAVAVAMGWGAAAPSGAQVQAMPGGFRMEKHVSREAHFVLYKPAGWQVYEGTQPTFRTLAVCDPGGQYEAAVFYGTSPTSGDVLALTRLFVSGVGRQFPDLTLTRALTSPDGKRIVYDAVFTHPQKGPRAFRCWVIGCPNAEFLYMSIEAPRDRMEAAKPLLMTTLSNVRIMRGAFGRTGAAPIQVRLVPYRLSDGSAAFQMPQGWRCQEFGNGCFWASDPAGSYGFIVASVDVITPQLGVTFPGAIISPYRSPSSAMAFLCNHQGLASNMRFTNVIPRADLAGQLAQVYTAGPVQVEEFLYTCTTRGGLAKGYTFGLSFGSRLGTNWNYRHATVIAPADAFDRFLGTFATMLGSYQINDQWARNYVAQGMARLRQLQQQTSAMVARNAQEIRQMMQAAYDERQRSMDYIDYQRTNYIRGQQDWVSQMEGGTIYHTDAWGTTNTTTGERWDGKAYDYYHYQGQNPKYNEQMQGIDSRRLWERHVR